MFLPKIYGKGALFAFSGFDGDTNRANDLVAVLTGDNIGLEFILPVRRELTFEPRSGTGDIAFHAVTGDMIDATAGYEGGTGSLFISFVSHSVIAGRSVGFLPVLRSEAQCSIYEEGDCMVSASASDAVALYIRKSGDEAVFSLCYSANGAEDAVKGARAGVDTDLQALKNERYGFFRALTPPAALPPEFGMLYAKCASVMKLNTYTAEGNIPCRWTTPDRVPHKNMWLWDSVFHALGLVHICRDTAVSALEAVLSQQREDGFIPHMMSPTGGSGITQPPILAWGYSRICPDDTEILKRAYPRLCRYLEWDMSNRDENGNNLYEWYIEGNPSCRCGESGMDNSPRFDTAVTLDAVDFSSFMANEARCMGYIAEKLGYTDEQKRWTKLYKTIANAINTLLWDEQDGMYYDRGMDAALSDCAASSGFLPLFCGAVPPNKAGRLVEKLTDKTKFGSPLPVPSVSLDSPKHSTDMWRGSVWMNYNYMIILGLREYGFHELADSLTQSTLSAVLKWYNETGCIYEFYHTGNIIPPPLLERKGPVTPPFDLRHKIFNVSDYNWTAAVTIDLMHGYYEK